MEIIKTFVIGISFSLGIIGFTHPSTAPISLYTSYTPSERILIDQWLLPSLQDNFKVILYEISLQDAVYSSKKEYQRNILKQKVSFIIKAIQESMHQLFIYSDAGVQFFAQLKNYIMGLMSGKDILIEASGNTKGISHAFFICKASKKMLSFWQNILMSLEEHDTDISGIQELLSTHIYSNQNPDVIHGYLPNSFLSDDLLDNNTIDEITFDNIIMHHANLPEEIDHKITHLENIRSKIMCLKKDLHQMHSAL